MKIYVDELPVDDCPCNRDGRCQLLNQSCNICWRDMPKNKDCPLTLISDHDKQVRNEVCEELYNKCVEKMWTNDEGFDCVNIDNIKDILDQIQGETK